MESFDFQSRFKPERLLFPIIILLDTHLSCEENIPDKNLSLNIAIITHIIP